MRAHYVRLSLGGSINGWCFEHVRVDLGRGAFQSAACILWRRRQSQANHSVDEPVTFPTMRRRRPARPGGRNQPEIQITHACTGTHSQCERINRRIWRITVSSGWRSSTCSPRRRSQAAANRSTRSLVKKPVQVSGASPLNRHLASNTCFVRNKSISDSWTVSSRQTSYRSRSSVR